MMPYLAAFSCDSAAPLSGFSLPGFLRLVELNASRFFTSPAPSPYVVRFEARPSWTSSLRLEGISSTIIYKLDFRHLCQAPLSSHSVKSRSERNPLIGFLTRPSALHIRRAALAICFASVAAALSPACARFLRAVTPHLLPPKR